MIRLTKHIRSSMVHDLLKRRFNADGEALCARSADLFDLVYNDRYKHRARKLMSQIQADYRGAFRMRNTINCRHNGMQINIGNVRLGYDGSWWSPKIDPRPFLFCDDNTDNFRFTDCPIAEKLAQFAADQVAFANAINAAQTEALGALSTVTTERQLQDLWPEAMPILAKYAPVAGGTNLPAVQFSKLTEAFGLGATA